MRIQFDAAFNSSYLCQPIYSRGGELLAVELICRFVNTDSKLVMPTELVLNLLSSQQRYTFLQEQIAWATQQAAWFESNKVSLNITIEDKLANLVIEYPELKEALKALPFVNINVSESFPEFSLGRKNKRLTEINQSFSLWLEGFGSGNGNMAPIFDGMFSWVKLDKNFFWRLYAGENFAVILPSLLRNVHRFCRNVVIDGLDTAEYLSAVYDTDIQGVKGLLWPGVEPALLDSLLARPPEFH